MAKHTARSTPSGALLKRALAAHEQGRTLQAELLYLEILEHSPEHAAAHNLVGVLKFQRGEAAQALAHFDRALRAQPGFADAHNSRGNALLELGRPGEALESFEAGLAVAPGNPDLLHNRGAALQALGRHAEAAASFRGALAARPHDAAALNDLGVSLRALDREEEALECFNRALQRRTDFAQALTNRGNALMALGRPQAAIASHRSALALDSSNADVRLNLAIAELATGDWGNGWRDYARRHAARQFRGRYRVREEPLWQGEAELSQRRILLHAEQGFGDTIMFARYVPLVAARGAHVVLEVQPRLKRLLESIGGAAQVVAAGETLPAVDLQCPLPSLPLAFGTTPETVPGGAYLAAPAAAAAKWQARLGALPRPRVGIVWSGGAIYGKDRTRSIALRELQPLLAAGCAQFVSLQKEVGTEDAAALAALGIPETGADQEDFCDAAGLIAHLDLVISVDTAVAHLAGAMGKPVWLLLSYSPDWRWMREREDSPWYPATRLFRQRQPAGGWGDAVARAADALLGWRG